MQSSVNNPLPDQNHNRGGARPGAGRKPGSLNKRSAEMVEAARQSGELPHEFLLRVARGEVIAHKKLDAETGEITDTVIIPTFEHRVDAAKNVSPYFAAKLATIEVTQALDDETLDQLIQQYATGRGAVDPADGEGETSEDSGRPAGRVRISEAAQRAVLGFVTSEQVC